MTRVNELIIISNLSQYVIQICEAISGGYWSSRLGRSFIEYISEEIKIESILCVMGVLRALCSPWDVDFLVVHFVASTTYSKIKSTIFVNSPEGRAG